MTVSNQQHRISESILDTIIRPYLLNNEFRKYIHFIRYAEKGLRGESCTHPSIIQIEGKKRILIIAPHPDDEVLGCGGTLRKYAENGSRIKTLYLTDGSRGNNTIEEQELINARIIEAKTGLKILGIDEFEFFNFKDSQLRTNKKSIEMVLRIIEEHHPDIIFLPFFLDNHPDHKESAIITAYALRRYKPPLICYCYEVWTALFPNVLIDITDTMDKKIQSIEAHESQVSHLNLVSSVTGLNSYRSLGFGDNVRFCEAFYRCSKEHFIKIVLKY